MLRFLGVVCNLEPANASDEYSVYVINERELRFRADQLLASWQISHLAKDDNITFLSRKVGGCKSFWFAFCMHVSSTSMR